MTINLRHRWRACGTLLPPSLCSGYSPVTCHFGLLPDGGGGTRWQRRVADIRWVGPRMLAKAPRRLGSASSSRRAGTLTGRSSPGFSVSVTATWVCSCIRSNRDAGTSGLMITKPSMIKRLIVWSSSRYSRSTIRPAFLRVRPTGLETIHNRPNSLYPRFRHPTNILQIASQKKLPAQGFWLTKRGNSGFTSFRTQSTGKVLDKVFFFHVPQKRLVEPQEIADFAVCLASDKAYGITGQAISVSAGW